LVEIDTPRFLGVNNVTDLDLKKGNESHSQEQDHCHVFYRDVEALQGPSQSLAASCQVPWRGSESQCHRKHYCLDEFGSEQQRRSQTLIGEGQFRFENK
jgi:hypothetical protein